MLGCFRQDDCLDKTTQELYNMQRGTSLVLLRKCHRFSAKYSTALAMDFNNWPLYRVSYCWNFLWTMHERSSNSRDNGSAYGLQSG